MANTLLTPTIILKEAQRILHNKLTFVGSIDRQYDDRFKNGGATVYGKIGPSLQIRKPIQVKVRTGLTMSTQDVVEESLTLTVSTVKGVDLSFTSLDLAQKLDDSDISKRIIEPAMARLASEIEADAFSMYKDVYNLVGTAGTIPQTLRVYLQAKQKLNENLCPKDENRSICLPSEGTTEIVNALSTLLHDSKELDKQYKEGEMGRALGFDWYENELVPTHTTGTQDGTFNVSGASQSGSSLAVKAMDGGATFKKGTVFTIAGCNAVHPETKVALSSLQQFIVTDDVTAQSNGNATLSISPSIAASGAYTTVDELPADNAVITPVGSPSTNYRQYLAYNKEAFTFVTADLPLPDGVDFAARDVYDGIAMSIIRDFTITDRSFPCRIDILYGYLTTRAPIACRITS